MKKLSLIIFLALCINGFAQNDYPKIERIINTEKIITGNIDEDIPITIYLQFYTTSNTHGAAYSVKGWYYYDKYQQKIPLVGIYDGELTLYYFDNEVQSNAFVNFGVVKYNYSVEMKYYKNIENYKEKFVFSNSIGKWYCNDKELSVNINTDELEVLQKEEFLVFDNSMAIDLHQFGNWDWHFQLFAAEDNVYILEFEYMSNQKINGMCGAGQEKGFLYLEYNSKNQLTEYKIFYIESCLNGIWIEEQKTAGDKIKYLIEDTGNDFKYYITLEKQNASLEYLLVE